MGIEKYPSIGASLAKELASPSVALPPYVSVAPSLGISRASYGSGFLGPKYAPLIVGSQRTNTAVAPAEEKGKDEGFAELKVDALAPPENVTSTQMASRLDLWKTLENHFLTRHPGATTKAHLAVYDSALRMTHGDAANAFNLSEETNEIREAYGKGTFGQGCLLARRLIERGVPFIEVSLTSSSTAGLGWDTHSNNFESVASLSAELDAGWATLMTDLRDRGLLESTTIVWMGEFGRTPQINGRAGRDHFPSAWSCVLAGGGIAGGQVYGRTSPDGMKVEENQVSVTQVLSTVCAAVGVSPETQNISNLGRPIAIVDDEPIVQLLG